MFLPQPEIVIPEKHSTCKKLPPPCVTCSLYKDNRGPCQGCYLGCTMRSCERQCGTCGGGGSVLVPAICCKSPLKEPLLEAVNQKYDWHTTDPISFKFKGVLTVIGGKSSICRDETPYIPEINAIAVNLRHVWSKSRGWYSADLKDYMDIPKDKKLILITAMYDDVLDNAWRQDLFEGFKEVGFDYWAPLQFSQYVGNARMMQFWNHKRSQYSLHKSKAHFTVDPLFDGFDLKAEYLEMIKHIPNVMFNCQLMAHTDESMRNLFSLWRGFHTLAPKNVSVWLIGVGSPKVLKTALLAMPGRDVYPVSTAPWIIPHKGKLYHRDGKVTFIRSRDKKDLLFESQRNFVKMVADCHKAVKSLTTVASA